MRVLGVDPGSRFMGFGAVEDRAGRLAHLGHGVLRVDGKEPLERRLKGLFEGLMRVIRRFAPEALAVEGVFTLRNARSALILGHARGVVLLAAAQHGLSVHEYAPARVKRAVGTSGAADKEAVTRMVKAVLGIHPGGRADAFDALAIAICHLNRTHASLPTSGPLEDWRARLSPAYRRHGAASQGS